MSGAEWPRTPGNASQRHGVGIFYSFRADSVQTVGNLYNLVSGQKQGVESIYGIELAQILHRSGLVNAEWRSVPKGRERRVMDKVMRILARTFIVCGIAAGLGLTAWSLMLTIGSH